MLQICLPGHLNHLPNGILAEQRRKRNPVLYYISAPFHQRPRRKRKILSSKQVIRYNTQAGPHKQTFRRVKSHKCLARSLPLFICSHVTAQHCPGFPQHQDTYSLIQIIFTTITTVLHSSLVLSEQLTTPSGYGFSYCPLHDFPSPRRSLLSHRKMADS